MPKPPIAPEIVVEVRSPDDRAHDIRRKTELYLANGAILVANVDPETRRVELIDKNGQLSLGVDDVVTHPEFPDLRIPVAEVFAPLDDL